MGLQGLISYLLSSEPEAQRLRSHLTFLVTPMLNPDGVFLGAAFLGAHHATALQGRAGAGQAMSGGSARGLCGVTCAGNYRCDSSGVDLNRMWVVGAGTTGGSLPALSSQMELLTAYQASPDFQVLKAWQKAGGAGGCAPGRFASTADVRSGWGGLLQVDLFIDVHAHSTSRSSFMFCNRPSAASAGPGDGVQAALERVVRLPRQVHMLRPSPRVDLLQGPRSRCDLGAFPPFQRWRRLLEAMMPGFSLSCCVFDDDKAKAGCARRAVSAPTQLSAVLTRASLHPCVAHGAC